jgi:Family of unknown function (DUF6768)
MNDLDDAIRQGYSAEDAELMQRLAADPSLPRMVLNTFQGPFGAFNVLGWIAGFALFATGAYCAWRFAAAPELRAMLLWGAGAALAASGLVLVKLWFWMELQRNAVVREIKRLELQVSRLAARAPS